MKEDKDLQKLTGIEGIIEDEKIITICDAKVNGHRPKYCKYAAFYDSIECQKLYGFDMYCKSSITDNEVEVRLYDHKKLRY